MGWQCWRAKIRYKKQRNRNNKKKRETEEGYETYFYLQLDFSHFKALGGNDFVTELQG